MMCMRDKRKKKKYQNQEIMTDKTKRTQIESTTISGCVTSGYDNANNNNANNYDEFIAYCWTDGVNRFGDKTEREREREKKSHASTHT